MPDFRFINSRPVDLREVEKLAGTIQRRKTAKEVENHNNDKDTARRAKQLSEFSAEFEKAVLLKREVAKDFILLPFINHYLDRAVFFAQLSQQTNNIVHLNKAYKRAHLVCMVLKYLAKDKYSNLAPSARLRTAIKKGLYL